MYKFFPSGVCSKMITFDVVNDKVSNIIFVGGCSGNAKGIAKLAEGMDIEEVIERLSGIRCGEKITSCPDQLSKALIKYIDANENKAVNS